MAGLDIGAIAEDSATPAPKQRKKMGRPKIEKGPNWVDKNAKRTFYFDTNVLDAIDVEAKKTGISKSKTLNAALASYYNIDLNE